MTGGRGFDTSEMKAATTSHEVSSPSLLERLHDLLRGVKGGCSAINALTPTPLGGDCRHQQATGRRRHRDQLGQLNPRDEHITDQEALVGLAMLRLTLLGAQLWHTPAIDQSLLTSRGTTMRTRVKMSPLWPRSGEGLATRIKQVRVQT
jgi:hypothetical protein